MEIKQLQKLYKSQPDLYSILFDIEILSTSNKDYKIELTHRKAKILRRYINKLEKQVENLNFLRSRCGNIKTTITREELAEAFEKHIPNIE